jgi:hypothetical protein
MHWQGELLHIHAAPKASAPMEGLSEARLVADIGLEGDRYATRLGTYSKNHHIDRQVTLIEVEVLEALARDRGIELASHEHRRNLMTRDVPLSHLVGQYFRIGECVLYGGRLNVPCLYLENLLSKKVFKPLLNARGSTAELSSEESSAPTTASNGAIRARSMSPCGRRTKRSRSNGRRTPDRQVCEGTGQIWRRPAPARSDPERDEQSGLWASASGDCPCSRLTAPPETVHQALQRLVGHGF